MNLWLSLNKALSLYGDREALVDGKKRFTYRQFGRRVANLIKALTDIGLKKGDVIGITAPNCHEYMEAYYACAVSGIVLSPLNYRLAVPETVAILNDAEARALIVHMDFAKELPEIIKQCKQIEKVIFIGGGPRPKLDCPSIEFEECATAGDGIMPEPEQLKADDLAQIYFTSGTTGLPKGVMLTQGNVTFNALAVVADLKLCDQDVWLHAAPMFHLADAWATFAITWVGGKHIFIPYFRAIHALEAIDKDKITLTVLVPTMLNAMVNDPKLEEFNYSSLRLLLTGGSPIAPELVRAACDKFSCQYIQLYGMTETSPFLTLSQPKHHQLHLDPTEQLDIRCRTGRPYIGAEVRVVRPDDSEVEHNNLEVGEIVARGPTIFAGYWKKPQATAETIRNGWIHTGDLAVVDEEGFINIVDRAKDMIITGGENVYSTEVEHALHEHPGVLECAVMGVPDEFWGESVKAVVVAKQGHTLTEAELIEFARQRLAAYKVPRSVDFLAELPKTGSGKIFKKGLRERYWTEREKQVN
jgi:acyl-CoA synthetase (AMP-forming)/AMP-acid ligase II